MPKWLLLQRQGFPIKMVDHPVLITVLRHGEVEGAPFVFRGSSNPPLSPDGWKQMRSSLTAVNLSSLHSIASSPLIRCQDFAEKIAAELGITLDILPDLQEIHFGDWEELTPQAAQVLTPDLFDRFQHNPAGLVPPNGEAFDVFRQRVTRAFNSWVNNSKGKHRLLITHAGVMRVLLSEHLGLTTDNLFRIALPPAASFQVSLFAGHPPCLLNLNNGQPCAA